MVANPDANAINLGIGRRVAVTPDRVSRSRDDRTILDEDCPEWRLPLLDPLDRHFDASEHRVGVGQGSGPELTG
jgi:hypothetical protein